MATIVHLGGGGGGVDLNIEGGTTKPANPSENTLWLKTDVPLGRITISPIYPLQAVEGDIWINTGARTSGGDAILSTGVKTLTILEDPFIEINILNFFQYRNNVWEWVDGGIFIGKEWVNMALYIFMNGAGNPLYPIKQLSLKSSSYLFTIADFMKTPGEYPDFWVKNPPIEKNNMVFDTRLKTEKYQAICVLREINLSNFNKFTISLGLQQHWSSLYAGFISKSLLESANCNYSKFLDLQSVSISNIPEAGNLTTYTYEIIPTTGLAYFGLKDSTTSDYHEEVSMGYLALT